MSNDMKPDVVYRKMINGVETLEIKCPSCGVLMQVNQQQFKAIEALDCIECDYKRYFSLNDVPVIDKLPNGNFKH